MSKRLLNDGFGLANTNRSLPMQLLRAREVVMDRFRPHMKEHQFTEQQWRVLRVLREVEEVDSTNLAAKANVLMPSLTRIIKLLEARGLIESRRDSQDKRRSLVRLTAHGDAAILAMAPDSERIYHEIERDFGGERMTGLLDELDALIQALQATSNGSRSR